MNSTQEIKPATVKVDPTTAQIICAGDWNYEGVAAFEPQLPQISWPQGLEIIIDGSQISAMDTSGALKLQQLIAKLQQQHFQVKFQNFSAGHQELLKTIEAQIPELKPTPPPEHLSGLAELGKKACNSASELLQFIAFTGETAIIGLRSLFDSRRLHWLPLLRTIELTGYQALPLIALLSFMIGVVLTYQMGLELRNYGADIFIVDLLGSSVLREFGVLLTAIIVVGRSGSAFTAQLGIMKLNEEIDALKTMGLVPTELLILPRLIGLVIVLPLLTVWADIFGIFGGMVMAKGMLNIHFYDFLSRFQQQVSINSLLIGLGKAPVFALLIASIGCFQGMRVSGGAESVGEQTTKSVVQALFIIIIADAIFSILFSKFNL